MPELGPVAEAGEGAVKTGRVVRTITLKGQNTICLKTLRVNIPNEYANINSN